MLPPGNSSTPPPDANPAATQPGTTPMNGPQDQAVVRLRKMLGLPENQPVPEQKLIHAVMGRLGPQAKQAAEAVGAGSVFKPNDQAGAMPPGGQQPPPTPGGNSPNGVPSVPDQSQAGGQAVPPNPQGPDLANAPAITPGSSAGGKMGSSTIFGRPGVGAIGEQSADQASGNPGEDEDDGPLNASKMFRRR